MHIKLSICCVKIAMKQNSIVVYYLVVIVVVDTAAHRVSRVKEKNNLF